MTSKGFTGKKGPRKKTMSAYLEAKLLVENGYTIVKACETIGLSKSSYTKVRRTLEKK